jgi:hypothetical protein
MSQVVERVEQCVRAQESTAVKSVSGRATMSAGMPVYVWGISAAVGILVVVAAAVWFVRGRHA